MGKATFTINTDEMKEMIRDWDNLVDNILPKKIGNEIVNFSKNKFITKEWANIPWVQSINNPNTLIKSGDLRDSIHVVTATKHKIVVEADEDYAKLQNEGGTITITTRQNKFFWAMWNKTRLSFWKAMALKKVGSTMIVPKRQFMGDNDPKLKKEIKKMIKKQLKKKLK